MLRRIYNRSGISSLELAVVLALIAIMATFTIPYLGSWLRHYRIVGAARELTSTMQDARLTAVKNNMDSCVEFDPANNRYCIKSSKGANATWDAWSSGDDIIDKTISFSGGSYKNIVFGKQTNNTPVGGPDSNGNPTLAIPADSVSFNNNRCEFNPNGTSNAGVAYITNTHETYSVKLGYSITGHIQIWHWNPVTSMWDRP